MPGANIGNYELLKKLATGGMAEVWLANQTGIQGFNRHIVVKRILPHLSEDPEFVQMFLNEAKIASRFNHPNIAQIYDLGQGDGQYFIAMEFIHGEDLGRLMRKAWSTGQWIARPLAIRIIAEACKGLFYAHTRNDENGRPLRVVHRDISPQNILISFDGSVKLVDFGIAKAADQASMTKSGAIKGKFAYMAPEQAGGKPLDARTDIFALGLVLYELLTGVRPLKRDSELATLQAALECAIDPPSVVAEVPAELDDVVMRALAKAPDDRYRDASMFQMALEEFLIGQRLVATSVQIAELMETLFAERRAEEQRLGAPNPSVQGESQQGLPAMPDVPAKRSTSQSRLQSRTQPPAPPPRAPPEEDDEQREPGEFTDRARPGEAGTSSNGNANNGQVQDWEAPPAEPQTVLPSRRYSNNSSAAPQPSGPHQTAMQRAHQPNGPEVTRAKPATREFEEYQDPPAPSRRPSRIGMRRSSNGVSGEALARPPDDRDSLPPSQTFDADPPETIPPPPAPRRTASSAGKLKRTATGEMPSAPPRRSRGDVPEPVTEEPSAKKKPRPKADKPVKAKDADLDRVQGDVDSLKRKQARTRGAALIGMLLISLAALVFIFRDKVTKTQLDDGVPVKLTVSSNPRTRVIVKHGGTLNRQPTDLGETPIEDQLGAYVGDTILLVNDPMCLTYEESIQFGEPMERRNIERTFVQTELIVNTKPPLKGLTIYCNGQKVGTAGMKLLLYEGPHKLEIRDDRLTQVVAFDVQMQAKTVNRANVELGDAVRK